jgi:hypothetical protein
MRHRTTILAMMATLALSCGGAFAAGTGDHASATTSSSGNLNSGTGSQKSLEASTTGADKSGLPVGQGTTTADAAKASNEQQRSDRLDLDDAPTKATDMTKHPRLNASSNKQKAHAPTRP